MTKVSNKQSARLMRAGGLMAGAALMMGPAAASAATIVFDFGLIGANGGSPCANKCVLPTVGGNFFTKSGVTVGAIGFNASDAVAYTTQKPGAFNGTGGETGLGESDAHPKTSNSDYEVTTKTWLLIDNSAALAGGYLSATFSIESMQKGEGAQVYAYTGPLTSLDTTKLSLLATLSNPGTGNTVTQTIAVPNTSKYLVVQAYDAGGHPGADIVVAQEVLNTNAVPEPATWAMMLAGLGGVGAMIRRRTRMGAAV